VRAPSKHPTEFHGPHQQIGTVDAGLRLDHEAAEVNTDRDAIAGRMLDAKAVPVFHEPATRRVRITRRKPVEQYRFGRYRR
jgi:hypothetical protein